MQPDIRKLVTYNDEVLIAGFRPASTPWRLFALAAVVKNPWASLFVDDLKSQIQTQGPVLGMLLSDRIIALAGSGDPIAACGKAAMVGLDGEVEHASGLIQTSRFGNCDREPVGARSYLAFTTTHGPANAPVMVPPMDENDPGRRSHCLTAQFSIPDAPRADEIAVVPGGATGGRSHRQSGDRYQDVKDLGHGLGNPAAI